MLDIPGMCVAQDSSEAETVKKQNEDYSKVDISCVVGSIHLYSFCLFACLFFAACGE